MQDRTLVILIVCIAAVIAAGCTSLQGSTAKSAIAQNPRKAGDQLEVMQTRHSWYGPRF